MIHVLVTDIDSEEALRGQPFLTQAHLDFGIQHIVLLRKCPISIQEANQMCESSPNCGVGGQTGESGTRPHPVRGTSRKGGDAEPHQRCR